VFARIAEVLARRRPDIPLLLVEGAARTNVLAQLGIDLAGLKNVTIMPNTPDPREFYAATKLLLMPSLMENAGFVAMEAMTNGIPVLASNRGGLPETIGDAAPMIMIPARYTPKTREVPTAEEVEPWVKTILRLWDDAAEYERWRQAALARSQRWRPESLAKTYADFFGRLVSRAVPVVGDGKIPTNPKRQPGSDPATSLTLRVSGGCDRGPYSLASTSCIVGAGRAPRMHENAPARPFVTCKWSGQSGRLGNQMFQIAATIGTARKNGLDYVFPRWTFSEYFARAVPQTAELPETDVYRESSFAYNDIRVGRPTNLAGCFQSERYFKHCAEEIRGYFAPRPELPGILRQRFGELLSKPTCSVHVRRGDYVGDPHYADLAATDYYERAIDRFAAETTFLFFSDDIAWCQDRFRDRRFAFVKGQSSIEDLFLMSLCEGHIIANSSLSWWGAWLDGRPGKTVIAPARWFAGSYADPSLPFCARPYQGYHETRDIIPEDWMKL
jgi:hypothetical protein